MASVADCGPGLDLEKVSEDSPKEPRAQLQVAALVQVLLQA